MNIVLTNDARTVAGGEKYVLHLAEGLLARGHSASIVALADSRLAEVARERGFHTIEFPFASGGREPALGWRLARILRPLAPDIVHSNSNHDRTIGAIAARLAGCASVASVHSCLSIRHNLTHRFRNRFLIDHFTPVGHSTEVILTGHDGIPARKVTVVHIGIPVGEVTRSKAGRERIRAECGFSSGAVVVGTLSRLVAFKGHTHLIAAAALLRDRLPLVRYCIAGDGELRGALAEQASRAGIADRIAFTGHRSDIGDVLSAFDVFTQPSNDFGGETFPVSMIEAAAVGLPIVASDVGDIRSMVEHEGNGLLVEPSRPDFLASALERVAGNEHVRATMAARSREIYLRDLTLEKMTERMEAVYARVLAARG